MSFHKMLVIGLDGAPYPLIQKWTQEGFMPNLAKLINRGSFGVLRSTIPVHSPTAWASFITGLNPGKHGVFDFVRRAPDSYQLRVIRANQFSGTTLWRWLSIHKRQVGVMNIPMTYPPEEVNGFLISGLGTPDYVPYTYPPELTDELNALGYRVNKDEMFVPGKEDQWLADIYDVSRRRTQAAVKLMQEKPWDFFMMMFRNTDEICHFFWHHMDESHPLHDPQAPDKYKHAIRDYYQQVDAWVGEIMAAAAPDTNIIIMSDHGAGPLYKDVFLNEWLWQQGWLTLKESSAVQKAGFGALRQFGITRKNISDTLTRLRLHRVEVLIKKWLGDRIQVLPRDQRPEFTTAVDWSKTVAYSFGYYGQIFINLRGREPNGFIEPGAAYETLRQEIAQRLLTLVDLEDGQPVVDRVYYKEELYDGPHLHDAPDLICIMREFTYMTRKGYEFAAQRGNLFRTPYTHETGSHRLEGILIGAGPDIQPEQRLPEQNIYDLTPTLLHLLHCPVPGQMDGKVIEPFIKEQFLTHYPIQYKNEAEQGRIESDDQWDEQAEAQVTERLKSLGYLG
ncbi:MAG: alkaline phosphatase family protein [Anaerolineae bacterium]|nr:alkaline phosphatase family protein [Anaerolineae bacterium]